MSTNPADYTIDWHQPTQYDPAKGGAPYVLTQSGRRSYLAPIQAFEMGRNNGDQRLLAWAQSQGATETHPSGNAPQNTFAHQNNGWNPQTGQYDMSLNQGGLMGLIEGAGAVAAPLFAGPAIAGAVGGGAAGGTAAGSGLAADGTLASTVPAGLQSAALGGMVIPAAGIGAGATAADIAAGSAAGNIGAAGAAGLAGHAVSGAGTAVQHALTDPNNLGSLAGLLTSLAGMNSGGNTGQDSAEMKRIQAITEARMRRADPLHQMVVQLAASRMPTNVQRPVPDIPLPQ